VFCLQAIILRSFAFAQDDGFGLYEVIMSWSDAEHQQ
jgi:hypothetical protein